jgi:hypothetical protein
MPGGTERMALAEGPLVNFPRPIVCQPTPASSSAEGNYRAIPWGDPTEVRTFAALETSQFPASTDRTKSRAISVLAGAPPKLPSSETAGP